MKPYNDHFNPTTTAQARSQLIRKRQKDKLKHVLEAQNMTAEEAGYVLPELYRVAVLTFIAFFAADS